MTALATHLWLLAGLVGGTGVGGTGELAAQGAAHLVLGLLLESLILEQESAELVLDMLLLLLLLILVILQLQDMRERL